MSSQPGNEKRALFSGLGAQGLFKRYKDQEKHKNKEESGKDTTQENSKHGEEPVEQATKRRGPSSWRFSFPGAMFTRSQSQYSPSERGVQKQSTFGERLEKKAALSTILSALSKKQSQEKEILGNSRDKISRQVSLPAQWSSGAGMHGKLPQRRPMSELIEKSGSMLDSCQRPRPSSLSSYDSGSRVSTNTLTKSDVIHEVPAPRSAASTQYGHAKLHASSFESRPHTSTPASLSSRRVDTPTSLPEGVGPSTEGRANDVVVVSPSCISRKRLSSGSDSVTVSTAFQVQGQPTSRAVPSVFDPWSSSVSVCVPFQVTEDQEVRALPLSSSPTRPRPGSTSFPIESRPLPEEKFAEPAQVKATSEIAPPQKESIPSRDVRQAPKSLAGPEKSIPERGNETVVKTLAQQTSRPPDATDGPRKAGEKGVGLRARPQSTATKASYSKDDESSNRKATKDAKKPNRGDAKVRQDKEQTVAAATEVAANPRTRSLPFQREKALAPDRGPDKLSPRNTPKSRSVNSSPKISRARDSKSHNASKPSVPDSKRGRPQSDPLVGDKLENTGSRKGSPSLSRVGKSQAVDKTTEEGTLKAKLEHCEKEKSEAQEKVTAMELQLSVLSLLEKEKLQLQRQLNDVTQVLEKSKSEVVALKATNDQEKEAMVCRHEKLLAELEKSQSELEETRDKKELLEEEKQHLLEENDKNLKEFDIYLDKIEKLANENSTKMLDQGRLRGKLSLVENSLRVLKDCTLKLKEENSNLRASVMDFRTQFGCRVSDCAKEFESLIERSRDTGKAEADGKTAPGDDDREALMEELEINKRCVQTLLGRITELENEKSERPEGDDAKPEEERKDQESVDAGAALASVWEECCGLREKLETLQISYDSQTRRMEELEAEKEELKEEKKGLEFETKYLKNVLSYREDTQKAQVEHKTSKEMERMESNLGVAEVRVKDLEGEVDRLHAEKQALLMSILNLNTEQARQAEEDFDHLSGEGDQSEGSDTSGSGASGSSSESSESESESEPEQEEEGEGDEASLEKTGEEKRPGRRRRRAGKARSSDGDSKASRRERYNFRRALSSLSTESEYSIYSMRDGDDEDSSPELDGEERLQYLRELVKKLKAENRMLQGRMDEVTGEREEVLRQFEKLCDDYDLLESRLDKIDEDKKDNFEHIKNEKKALKAQVKELEKAREELEESLKDVKDEKLALLKCLEMRSAEEESSESADAALSSTAIEEIIARAHAFSQEEQKEKNAKREESSSEESSSEESSSEESSSSEEESALVGRRSDVEKEQRTAPEGRPDAVPRAERDDELASIVASIETDLGKLKAKLHRKTSVVDGKPLVRTAVGRERSESDPLRMPSKALGTSLAGEPGKLDSEPEKPDSEVDRPLGDIPSPAERFLARQASSVKVNLERVTREKQHLEGEVESLRQCFTRSLRRGSVATLQRKHSMAGRKMSMVAMADNQVEAIRTLQELLQRSDMELKESSRKISHLEEKNAEADEKIKESELLQSDLRQAVVISHNLASEETERAKTALEEREELLRTIRRLQKENEQFRHGGSPPVPSQAKRRLLKGRTLSDDSSYLAESEGPFTPDEGESDFYSSRHSSESDLLQSPQSEGPEEWPKQSEDRNDGMPSPSTERTGDTDEDSISRTSSTFSATE